MSNDEIKELIQLVVESGIAELEVERGETRVRIRRTLEPRQEIVMQAPAQGTMVETAHATPVPAPPPASNDHIQKSPIVGTYYDSPKPGEAPFVKVGEQVEVGQHLCIIESMKLMNEIEAEVTGTIVAKLVENGRPVEYGEALFTIRPR
jgi:acetyl-CoA carboxylase biotin carboxyl carrier protein